MASRPPPPRADDNTRSAVRLADSTETPYGVRVHPLTPRRGFHSRAICLRAGLGLCSGAHPRPDVEFVLARSRAVARRAPHQGSVRRRGARPAPTSGAHMLPASYWASRRRGGQPARPTPGLGLSYIRVFRRDSQQLHPQSSDLSSPAIKSPCWPRGDQPSRGLLVSGNRP